MSYVLLGMYPLLYSIDIFDTETRAKSPDHPNFGLLVGWQLVESVIGNLETIRLCYRFLDKFYPRGKKQICKYAGIDIRIAPTINIQ
jgi:hypothetical protein